MTVVLAAVYTPIGIQGGLTGSLFREFAFTLTGAVIISTVVALTLSPMMSSKLLAPGMSERGFAGKISRDFKRFTAFYGRLLNATLNARPAVYTVWILLGLATVPIFVMSPKELAPTEDQGVVFGIVDAAANATLDQTSRYAAAANDVFMSMPETQFTFQVTSPSSGFGGMVVPLGRTRAHGFRNSAGSAARSNQIPGIRMFAVTPPALPGGGQFPVEFVLASTRSRINILRFAQQLQLKAMQSGMFAFPPIIDVKIDQPQSETVHRPGQGCRPGPQPAAGGRRSGLHGGGQLRQPLQHRRPQLQGHPPDPAR
jgi:multidrug efflux pump